MTIIRGFEAGIAREGVLQEIRLTKIHTNETDLLGSPVTLGTVSAPIGVTYTYDSAHAPEWNDGHALVRQRPFLYPLIAGKVTAAVATTIRVELLRNGVSMWVGSQSVPANNYFTWSLRRGWNPALTDGDEIEIRLWTDLPNTAYYDWYAFAVLPSYINPFSAVDDGRIDGSMSFPFTRKSYSVADVEMVTYDPAWNSRIPEFSAYNWDTSTGNGWQMFAFNSPQPTNMQASNIYKIPRLEADWRYYLGYLSGDFYGAAGTANCQTHATQRIRFVTYAVPFRIQWRRMG